MVASCIAVAALSSITAYSQQNAVVYEGARLIIGDASAPIESGAFMVRNGHIIAIGPKGAIKAPAGAMRVDLTGKTVMPAMNNVHVHVGNEGYVSWSVENHSPENVLDHLEREAFYGVGTAMTMGDQPLDFAIKFQQDQGREISAGSPIIFRRRPRAAGRWAGCASDPGNLRVARGA